MPRTDLNATRVTEMAGNVDEFSVGGTEVDEAGGTRETVWSNDDWSQNLGYFKEIPELRQAIIALATWTAGKGYTTDSNTEVILEGINGWGEDTFQSIMENMIIVKKINGDAYAEIIRSEEGTLINLKPLNPARMRTIVNSKGLITRYEEDIPKGGRNKFRPDQIFHIVNDRTANEIHGTSPIESCKWVIDARNEAMADWRRTLHRSTIRVMYVDADDDTRLNKLKVQYKDAIKKGEVMLVPREKAGDVEFQDLQPPSAENFLGWIRYLENFFYQAVGVPKIILGGAAEYTEASSKVGYLTFEQVYMKEQRELEQDIWNQLALKIKFDRPVSLKSDIKEDEAANTGQVGFQPNETEATITRSE